jgi:phospholipid/cholesterol/gamma-HCH transport system ATP-binding protein
MESPILKVRGLTKIFKQQVILDALDLDIPANSVTTIIGRSGIGKSVLLKCLANIWPVQAGTMHYGELEAMIGQKSLRQAFNLNFSYMFQNNALFDSMSAAENIALPLRESTKLSIAEINDRVQALLDTMDLLGSANKYPAELSGGMQKRVALARALIVEPQIVFFDEPTTGLDPERKYNVFKMIAECRSQFNFAAVLVSHDIPEVFQISDRIAWIDRGKIQCVGDREKIYKYSDPVLKKLLTNADIGR